MSWWIFFCVIGFAIMIGIFVFGMGMIFGTRLVLTHLQNHAHKTPHTSFEVGSCRYVILPLEEYYRMTSLPDYIPEGGKDDLDPWFSRN